MHVRERRCLDFSLVTWNGIIRDITDTISVSTVVLERGRLECLNHGKIKEWDLKGKISKCSNCCQIGFNNHGEWSTIKRMKSLSKWCRLPNEWRFQAKLVSEWSIYWVWRGFQYKSINDFPEWIRKRNRSTETHFNTEYREWDFQHSTDNHHV